MSRHVLRAGETQSRNEKDFFKPDDPTRGIFFVRISAPQKIRPRNYFTLFRARSDKKQTQIPQGLPTVEQATSPISGHPYFTLLAGQT